jgi:hypothetical protein
LVLGTLLALVGLPATALAGEPAGVEHLHYAAGPYHITPGANLILFDYKHVPKPNVDGYMIRMQPNARYALPNGTCCGKVPLTNIIHLHHGVWLTNGAAGAGEGNGYGSGFYPFMATGEEKTIFEVPPGYGYPIGAKDFWVLNYMIHDLISTPANIYITYDMDFVPATAPAAAHITPLHPIWTDVEAHHIYPVFDVKRGGGRNGKFTFPDMAKNPYGGGAPLNQVTLTHPGTLIMTAGHLHPGGLYNDLDLIRAGPTPSGGAIPGSVPHSVRLFRSDAHYWDKRGPISWDLAMTGTPSDWRPQVKAGDVLRTSVTYETKRASWYESMGIMVVWEAYNDQTGVDPFTHKLDERGAVTHGHLPENNDHGGSQYITANANRFKDCSRSQVLIAGFTYLPGDLASPGASPCVPTVTRGHSLTFVNEDASAQGTFGNPLALNPAYLQSIFHTVTSCQGPCGYDTGISYPLANGTGNLDSGQLGAGLPAVGRLNWSTPKNLKPGTYYYFCRIHPFMRGVFRVIR